MIDTRACVAVGRVLFRRASRKSARARRRRGRRRRTSARARRDGDVDGPSRRRARPRRRRPRDRRERSFRAAAQRRTVSAMRAAARARDRPSGGGGDAADASAEQRGAPASRREARRPRRLGAPATPPRTPRGAKRRSCVARREPRGAARSRDRLRYPEGVERAAGAVGDGAVVLSFEPSPDARRVSVPAGGGGGGETKTPDARAVPKRARRIASSPPAGAGARACPSRVAHAVRSRRYRRRAKTRPRHRRAVSLDEPRTRRRGLARVTRRRRRSPGMQSGPRRRQRAGAQVVRGPGPARARVRVPVVALAHARAVGGGFACAFFVSGVCGSRWRAAYAVRGVERVLETRATCSAFVSVVTLDADEKAGRCGRGGRGVRGRGRGARAGRTFRAPERRRCAAGGAGGVPGAHPRRVACPEVFDSNEGCADSRSLLA